MRKITVSIIHTSYLDLPAEAWPSNEHFSEAAALAYVNTNVDKIIRMTHEAGRAGTDIVCTPEDFGNIGTYIREFEQPNLFASLVSKTADTISAQMRETAKRYLMYIAANSYECTDGKIYNTSTLYGRNGEITGKYKKVHLADSERWRVAPGEEFPVFETDIGNIGFITCYDMIMPETGRLLSLNGADMVVHQTQGWGTCGKVSPLVGESFMRVRAAENSVYLIVAKNIQGDGSDGGRSCIINNAGDIVAETSVAEEKILTVELEADFDMYDEYHFNNMFTGMPSTRARQLIARVPLLYKTLTEESPKIAQRYLNMKPYVTAEDGKKVMEEWAQKDDTERSKYHW